MKHSGRTLVVAGSSLKAGFLALLLDRILPSTDVTLVAEATAVGGTVQLPVMVSALPQPHSEMFDPLIVKIWSGFAVQGATRHGYFPSKIALLSAEQLHVELLERFGAERLRFADRITRLGEQSIELASGEMITAREVIDVRQQIGPQHSGPRGRRYAMAVRDVTHDAPHGIIDPILYKEIERSGDGIVFAQYLPLTESLLREIVYSPVAWSSSVPAGPGTTLRMERFTVDVDDLFDSAMNADFSAEAIDFATMLDGGIGALLAEAGQIAARQIRIIA